jgi:hypothetical protein
MDVIRCPKNNKFSIQHSTPLSSRDPLAVTINKTSSNSLKYYGDDVG